MHHAEPVAEHVDVPVTVKREVQPVALPARVSLAGAALLCTRGGCRAGRSRGGGCGGGGQVGGVDRMRAHADGDGPGESGRTDERRATGGRHVAAHVEHVERIPGGTRHLQTCLQVVLPVVPSVVLLVVPLVIPGGRGPGDAVAADARLERVVPRHARAAVAQEHVAKRVALHEAPLVRRVRMVQRIRLAAQVGGRRRYRRRRRYGRRGRGRRRGRCSGRCSRRGRCSGWCGRRGRCSHSGRRSCGRCSCSGRGSRRGLSSRSGWCSCRRCSGVRVAVDAALLSLAPAASRLAAAHRVEEPRATLDVLGVVADKRLEAGVDVDARVLFGGRGGHRRHGDGCGAISRRRRGSRVDRRGDDAFLQPVDVVSLAAPSLCEPAVRRALVVPPAVDRVRHAAPAVAARHVNADRGGGDAAAALLAVARLLDGDVRRDAVGPVARPDAPVAALFPVVGAALQPRARPLPALPACLMLPEGIVGVRLGVVLQRDVGLDRDEALRGPQRGREEGGGAWGRGGAGGGAGTRLQGGGPVRAPGTRAHVRLAPQVTLDVTPRVAGDRVVEAVLSQRLGRAGVVLWLDRIWNATW